MLKEEQKEKIRMKMKGKKKVEWKKINKTASFTVHKIIQKLRYTTHIFFFF